MLSFSFSALKQRLNALFSKVSTAKNIIPQFIYMCKFCISRFPKTFYFSIFMLIISAIVPYLQNWLTALLIDGILQNLSSKTYLDAQILILILLYAFFLFLFGSVDILSNTFSRLINYKVAYYFQMFFVESVSKLDREYFENPKTQEQVDRALRYGNTPQNMLLNGLDAFSSLVAVIVGLWVVYRLNPFLIIIVSFVYPGTKKKVLSNINLNISQGEHIAFVGENGAGKTTIIKLLLRFYDPTKGEILLDGVNIKNYTQESLYKAFGVLFQDYNFYHFTVKENIGYGNFENMEDFNSITSMAKKAGAHDFIMNYEYQYEQRMNKSFDKGITPSVGQKQRIAIARAFFRNAPILILDEPTSAIDPKAEYEIFEEILKFSKGKTVIIISHRFSTVRNADRILVLDKGKIIEEGSHEQLMLIKDGKYKHAFNLQKKGYE